MIRPLEAGQEGLFDAAGCFCLCGSDVLLLRRAEDKSYPGYWGVPTGRLKPGEDGQRAAIRELYEETGVLLSGERLASLGTFFVSTEEMSFTYALFVTTFEDRPSISVNAQEHSAWRWTDIDSLGGLKLVPDVADCAALVRSHVWPEPQLQLVDVPAVAPPTTLQRLQQEIDEKLPPPSGSDHPGWISVFGPPAAGKSTALKRIGEEDGKYAHIRANTILQNGTRLNRYHRQLIGEEDRTVALNFQVDILAVRYWQTATAPNQSLIDESIYSSLAYAKALWYMGWFDDDAFQTFYATYATYLRALQPAGLTVLLTADVEVLQDRMRRRDRKIERTYDAHYIDQIRRGCEEVAAELSESQHVQRLDTTSLTRRDVVASLRDLLS